MYITIQTRWLLGLLILCMALPSQSQRFRSRSSGGSTGGGGITIKSPLSPEQKEKFANAKPEDITNENFPETIESFDYPNAEIQDVIKAMAELTGKNLIIDPGVRGKITIIAPSRITVAEAYKAFLSALAINGYTTVPSGKFLKIRSSRNAQRDSIETYSGDYFPNSDQMITRIVHLKHISAEEVNKDLRVLTSKDGEISFYKQTNSLVISDYGSNIERVMRIINQLDVPGFEEKLAVMRVKYAKAKDIAELIEQIVNKDKDGGSRRSRFRSRRSNNKNDDSSSKSLNFQVIPDDRTNSLIVVGNNAGLSRVTKLLRQLDFELTPEEAGGVFVYYVKHGDAEEISQTLSGVAKQAGGDAGSTGGGSSRSSRNEDGPPVNTQQVFGGDVKITADKTTNSLIITASKQDYEVVLSLLEKIDIPRDQVFVEAVILEMNVNDVNQKEIGVVQWQDGGRFPGGFNGFQNLVPFIGPVPPTGTTLGFPSGKKVNVTLGGQTVEIQNTISLINFITTNSNSNVLSTPQITVLDNEEGEIEVGEKIIVGLTQTQTTTGVTNQSPNFEEANTKLKIKPFISPSSDSIRMEIDQIVQQPGKNIQETPGSIITTNRGVKTNIVVQDGDTIVLGGLMRDEIIENESKVPLLGDIPILGWLFRSTSKVVTKTNLVIFLTPHILRNAGDAKNLLSQKAKERIDFIKRAGGVDRFGSKFDKIISKSVTPQQQPANPPAVAPRSTDPSATPAPTLPPANNERPLLLDATEEEDDFDFGNEDPLIDDIIDPPTEDPATDSQAKENE